MRRFAAFSLALLLVSTTAAWAGDVEGKIQSVDTSDRVIVLEDGTKLWVAEGLSMDTLKEGKKVKASFDSRDGKNVLTSIEVAD